MTVSLAKHTPGSGLGYTWTHSDEVVEVEPEHVAELIKASHGDIYEVHYAPVESEVFLARPDGLPDNPADHESSVITEVAPGVSVVADAVPVEKAEDDSSDDEDDKKAPAKAPRASKSAAK